MRFLPLFALLSLSQAPSLLSADTTLLLDPFTIPAVANDTNVNSDIPARQSGSLTGGTYTELLTSPAGYANDAFIEKASTTFAGSDALLLRTFHSTTSARTAVRLSTDFGPLVAGKKWRVSFTGNIQRNSADITDSWLALNLGDTPGHVGPDNVSTDLGFFVRGSGAWTTFADGSSIASGAAAVLKSPDLYATSWTAVVTVDETVSPVSASAVVTVAGGGTFNLGPWNVTWENAARYLELRLHNGGNANSAGTLCDGRVDNLTVSLSGDPAAPPVLSSGPKTQSLWVGDSTVLSVIAESAATPTYQWSKDTVPITGATGATLALTNPTLANGGLYSVVVTNPNGAATGTATVDVTYPSHRQRLAEPLAISSKLTPLVFSEIMYHPAPRLDGRRLEFVELYNTNPWPEDLTGWRVSGDVEFAFPAGASIPAQGFLVVAASPADVQTEYGLAGVLGPWTGSLSNEGKSLRLRRANDAIVLEAVWNAGPDWPAAADGAGHSLVLDRPSFGERDVRAWSASSLVGGSPGAADIPVTSEREHVMINEILAHSTTGTDFVELFNSSPANADIGGCWLSDDPALLGKFQIPAGTILGPRGRISFTQTQLGFALSAEGETLYFSNAAKTRVIGAVRFRGQLPDTASGRFPDGEGPFRRLSSATPGAANSAVARGPVVLNELYFHPITNDSEEEWLELRNLTGSPVSLAGWRLSDGVSYDFPVGASIAANGYLVVAKNPARLKANHPSLSPAVVFGPFAGNLSDSGEEVVLGQPVTSDTPAGILTYFAAVDEVNYADETRWSRWADGGGSSLELADARDTSTPLWLDSDESAKAPWTLVEATGLLDNVHTNALAIADRLDALLLGPGEVLLDEVEATPSGGSNLITNNGFESGLGSWLVQGTHNQSLIENSGYAGTKSLRLVATGRGDIAPNRVRTPLTATIANNSTATLRARVRWLRGSDEFLLRLKGGALDTYAKLSVPKNLGTPGAPNGRALLNAAPAITDVSHRPALPVAGLPFRVFAQVADPSGVATVSLRYRIDPATAVTTLAMNDSGTGGDFLGGDGIYTATVPAQSSGTLVAFTVSATDTASASAVFPPTGEALARVGETLPSGAFGAYTMWVTASTLTAWNNRLPKTNEAFPVTLLHNGSRILYGTGAHFAQAFETSGNNPTTFISGYEIDLPPGERLFGENDVTLDWPVRDATNQREQLMHWMLEQMGLPTLHRRDVHLTVNGVRRTSATVPIYHEAHQPGRTHLASNFPGDENGRLLKTSNWDEHDDAGTRIAGPANSLLPYTTTNGVYKIARYRWVWRPRSTDGDENNFTELFRLVTAANTVGASYVGALSGAADMDQWMKNFAFADLCCYWDTFGNEGTKNAYLYKPVLGRWQVITNDMDVGLGGDINANHPPSSSALFLTTIDAPLQTMFNTPAFARHYWRAVSDSLATFFSGTAVTTRLTQRHNGYIANGIAVTSPLVASGFYNFSVPDWINQRVTFLQSQLATVSAGFALNTGSTLTTSLSQVTVTGSAPITVKTLTFNGIELPVTWSATTAWSAAVNVPSGTHPLVVAAFDTHGVQVASSTVSVTYTGATTWPALRINEWMADNAGLVLDPADGKSQDWIELYNPSGGVVSLTNWTLSDSTPAPGATFVIPAGYSVSAQGRLLVWADDETVQNTGSGQLHVPFKLSNAGETLTLRAPDGTVVDTVTFGAQVANISQGRIPDGGAAIDFLASPGAASVNSAAIAPPVATASSVMDAGVLTITVKTIPGFTYQLQTTPELSTVPWENLSSPVTATAGTLVFPVTPGLESNNFYRVVRTP